MSGDIIEGFLCPICMKDLGTVTQLQSHFEDEHSSEDKAVFQQLKGFFDKAKKKILGDKYEVEPARPGDSAKVDDVDGVSSYMPSWWQDQELGQTRNHTDSFRSLRDVRVSHFVVETNKLLIRLDKLLSQEAPTDQKKRKAYERSVVRWIPDSEVTACLNCMKLFGLLKRRHHCRLCGGVMCDKCSEFMSASYAQKLINPSHSFTGEGFLKRSSSNTSINSMLDVDGESVMRVCKSCRNMLERRDHMMELRNTKPVIVQLYDKMKMCIQEAEQILPEYMPMVESLSQGETVYTYSQALVLRTKLVRLYEATDQLSKKILTMNTSPTAPANSSRQVLLQKSIRLFASNFMQDNLMGLQSLPTEEDYNKLRDARTAEIQRRIAAERKAAMEAQERERQERERLEHDRITKEALLPSEEHPRLGHRRVVSGGDLKRLLAGARISVNVPPKGHTRNVSDTNMGSGWKPVEEPVKVSKSSDPMLQQMEIIRGYIRQAKQAHRIDEVTMLEQNLRDLETEFIRQQKGLSNS